MAGLFGSYNGILNKSITEVVQKKVLFEQSRMLSNFKCSIENESINLMP